MKKLIGLFTSVALMGSGVALANDDWKNKDKQTQSQPSSTGQDIGGSGQSGQMGQSGQGQSAQMGQSGQSAQGQSAQMGQTGQLSGTQLTGRVVKSDRKMVWVEHAGAIVPLKIDKNTQFSDPSLTRVQDLKEGDQIRASFEVRKTDNVATSIQKADSGMGGSGQDTMSPDSSINQSPDSTLPPANQGTGGSGDLGSDINTGTDINQGSGVGSDVGSDLGSTTGDH